MPERTQLSRAKGWRKPEGAIVVSRPSKWGNPFSVKQLGRELAVQLYDDTLCGLWNPRLLDHLTDAEFYPLADKRRAFIARLGWSHPAEGARAELAGHDLACWCPLVDSDGAPVLCHADVLLEIANA